MKRYDLVHDDHHGEGAWIDEVPNGDYIRHDDADLAALVAAATNAAEYLLIRGNMFGENIGHDLFMALSAVAGTTDA